MAWPCSHPTLQPKTLASAPDLTLPCWQQVLGFTRSEIDDILHGIRSEDLEGVSGPQDAAQRLLEGVYMAVVADLAQVLSIIFSSTCAACLILCRYTLASNR